MMMMRKWMMNALLVSAVAPLLACGGSADSGQEAVTIDDPYENGVAALGAGEDSVEAVEITTIADSSDGLAGPRDVEINPHAPNEMWLVNRDENSGTILTDFGTGAQESKTVSGLGSSHFAAKVSALAFGAPGYMATAQQEDEVTQSTTPADFMGPTLWPSDSADFEAGHASHLDMLHNSPLSSGVAWDEGNAYWIFDGHHGSITLYDFQEDHGPGGADHGDGIVRRYADGQLGVVKGIVAHIAHDRDGELLYIADTANNRIAVLETDTGEVGDRIMPNYDGTDQRMMDGAVVRTLVNGADVGLVQPAGLELVDDLLYVGDNGSSTLHAFTTRGRHVDSLDLSSVIPAGAMQGLEVDEDGRIYVTDSENNVLVRIAPK